jgi:NAD(P)-dependent dehydrogenase (short-subunit alcohol dehydrogenase family)
VSTRAADAGAPGALAGRVILISGAYGGLGRAAAIACAQAGATTVLLGRKVPKLNRVYDAIAKHSGDALPEPLNYPLDLAGATVDDYAELAARIEAQLGRLDGVLHCAADFAGLTPLEHTDPAAFARTLHVDLTARWWLTQACLPLLKRAADSAVVFAIDAAVGTDAYRGPYGLAQHAQSALVAMSAAELAASTVRISGLHPGPMRTPLRAKAYVEDDDRTARDPADYAEACVTLLSSAGQAHRGQVWSPQL